MGHFFYLGFLCDNLYNISALLLILYYYHLSSVTYHL